MKYDPDIHHRRSIRLTGFDYSEAKGYFVTICTQNRECFFGEIADGEMGMNVAGEMVARSWRELERRFPGTKADVSIVMPNHFHGIILLFAEPIAVGCRGESCIRPGSAEMPSDGGGRRSLSEGDHKDRPRGTSPGSIGRIIQAFKSMTTHEYVLGVRHRGWPPFFNRLWQRNYYEHVVRDEDELSRLREYISNNPVKWPEDEYHP